MQQTYTFIGFSLILLLVGMDCLPIDDATKQPAHCTAPRPKSSATSECSEEEKRFFFQDSNLKGCKRFGICPEDAMQYDNSSDPQNYFHSFAECQAECMQHVQCPELPVVDNLRLVSDNGLQGWGRKVTFKCVEGYSLADNSAKTTRTCQKNGTWSGVTPECLQQCPAPPDVDQGHIAPSKSFHNQGTIVYYTCNHGYNLEGDAQRTCNSTGEWEGPEPSCTCSVASDSGDCFVCPGLRPLNHASIHAPNRSVSAIAEYTCEPGFILHGNPTRECEASGEWSGEEPTCWNLTLIVRGIEDVTNGTVLVEQGTKDFRVTVRLPFNPFPDAVPRWTFNGENVLPRDVTDKGFTLEFTSILEQEGRNNQEGTYAFHIENFSASFKLETVAPPPAIIKPNVELFMVDGLPFIPTGGNIKFIYVVKGCPIPNVSLYFNGKAVSSDRVEHTYTPHDDGGTLSAGSITIKGVRESDHGQYTCVAKNIAGNATSSEVLVVVQTFTFPFKRSVEETPSVAKRSIDERNSETSLCAVDPPEIVTLVGRVEKQVRRARSAGRASYRVQVQRFIRGSNAENLQRVRTVVFKTEPETSEGSLSRNTDYVFRGRLLNKTLIVSRQNVQRHTTELESRFRSC